MIFSESVRMLVPMRSKRHLKRPLSNIIPINNEEIKRSFKMPMRPIKSLVMQRKSNNMMPIEKDDFLDDLVDKVVEVLVDLDEDNEVISISEILILAI
ncbi:MAG: hypothetical protein WCJ39_03040 [bacterium]